MNKNKNIAVYPGTFDPITFGHLDIIDRASKLFDKLIIAVSTSDKKKTFFDFEERFEMVKIATKNYKNIEIKPLDSLLINFLKKNNCKTIIRGLRAISDFEYEFQMALMNRKLQSEIETIFLMTDEKYSYLSSTMVKEIALLGSDIKKFVPEIVSRKIKERVK